jgi:hypothetical protein
MTSARKHKLQLKALKPRNPLVALTRARKAGKHEATGKAARQQGKRELKRELTNGN